MPVRNQYNKMATDKHVSVSAMPVPLKGTDLCHTFSMAYIVFPTVSTNPSYLQQKDLDDRKSFPGIRQSHIRMG